MEQTNTLRLCRAVEADLGRAMRTPKDFDFLSEQILERVHQHLSATTLKRLWGYLPGDTQPRQTTLDILAQFEGFSCWEAFCAQDAEEEPETQGDDDAGEVPETRPRWHRMGWIVGVCIVLIVAVSSFFLLGKGGKAKVDDTADSRLFIRKGQTFAIEHDYLKLFGIHAQDTLWGQRLPHHPEISIWSPLYHHHEWHNDGDSAQLLPTIYERWEPTDTVVDSNFVATRNSDRFISYKALDELRITFMRGLTPDGDSLTFLGVYRMDFGHSNHHHIIWVRVADEVDLSRLDYLEELRN